MPDLTKRRKWLGIAASTLLVGGIASYAYVLESSSGGPSPQEARAALAASGWCLPDAPIVERDGRLFIEDMECDLVNKRFGTIEWGGWFEYQKRDDYLARNLSWTPFGHWVARSSCCRLM